MAEYLSKEDALVLGMGPDAQNGEQKALISGVGLETCSRSRVYEHVLFETTSMWSPI